MSSSRSDQERDEKQSMAKAKTIDLLSLRDSVRTKIKGVSLEAMKATVRKIGGRKRDSAR